MAKSAEYINDLCKMRSTLVERRRALVEEHNRIHGGADRIVEIQEQIGAVDEAIRDEKLLAMPTIDDDD